MFIPTQEHSPLSPHVPLSGPPHILPSTFAQVVGALSTFAIPALVAAIFAINAAIALWAGPIALAWSDRDLPDFRAALIASC